MEENDQIYLFSERGFGRGRMAQRSCSTTALVLFGAIVLIVGVVLGVIIGFFSRQIPKPESDGVFLKGVSSKIISPADDRISAALIEEISSDSIRQYHKKYTSEPNLAGTDADERQANQLKTDFEEIGVDRVDINKYDILLSFPKDDDPNQIYLNAPNGSVIFSSQLEEKELRPDDINPNDKVVPPFNAYSASGDAQSEKLIYVNYGREEDFYWLKNNRSVDFNGSIAIARYGKLFRANKARLAEQFGAVGLILYSDPYDYADPAASTAYPDSWWLPETGVQRGTCKLEDGDPLTPFYPALESAYRLEESEANLPVIPIHPISFGDAKNLLQALSGEEAPASWQGSIKGLTYRLGGSFKTPGTTVKMHITTHNSRRTTHNVIAYIEGSVEPDRYVVLGNHHDGWVYGALDPISGTAAMLETARALKKMMTKYDWRPRRTIVFASWGAEESGLHGSMEWTEQFSKVLGQRTIAYFNIDILLEGMDHVRFKSTPALYPLIYETAKLVPNPNANEVSAGRPTVYDTWLHVDSDSETNLPRMRLVGSGSDYVGFLQVLGIPSLDVRYTWNSKIWRLSSYPLYHSVYETFYLVDNIMDPGYKFSRATTQLFAELSRNMADSLILPLDVSSFSEFLVREGGRIISQYGDLLDRNGLTDQKDYFDQALKSFERSAAKFVEFQNDANKKNPFVIREINDKLMNLHRSFLDAQGLPGRPMYKNLLAAPSLFNAYAGSVFPSLSDSLFRIEDDPDQTKRWNEVKKAFSIVTFTTASAGATLLKAIEFTSIN